VVGLILLSRGHLEARRRGLLNSTFWLTFKDFAAYRARQLTPLILYVLGLASVVAGLIMGLAWLLGFYAARFGHPAG
jgi:hypothetical protein